LLFNSTYELSFKLNDYFFSEKEKKSIFEMSLKKGAFFRESAKAAKLRCFFLGKILEKLVIFLDEKTEKKLLWGVFQSLLCSLTSRPKQAR
jgi:hypothetical protein